MEYSISLNKIINEFNLEIINNCDKAEEVLIKSADVNRPDIQLTGYFKFFDISRLQIFGNLENSLLSTLNSEQRYKSIANVFEKGIPAAIVTRSIDIYPELLQASNDFNIPLLRTSEPTSVFLSSLVAMLSVSLAPRETRHGVLVEAYGEGVLLLGESGVGKSETAIELVKRGHRLIADDAVEIKKVSAKTLVGSAPDSIRHFVELRGIGIVDVRRIFGMGSVKDTEKIDLVIKMELWDKLKTYDRLGLDDAYMEILGINVPCLTIPVRPGRNLAIIIEVAAMNNRQKKMGFNAAKELEERLFSTNKD